MNRFKFAFELAVFDLLDWKLNVFLPGLNQTIDNIFCQRQLITEVWSRDETFVKHPFNLDGPCYHYERVKKYEELSQECVRSPD